MASDISIAVPIPGGIELLVLDGSFTEGGEEFTRLLGSGFRPVQRWNPTRDRQVVY
jgi:hypothetical protein